MKISKELKKSLTNLEHLRVLELIGRSPRPLSSYEIVKKYSRDGNRYVYEIIRDLAKLEIEYLGEKHPERFLKISSNGKKNAIELTEKTLEIIKRNFRYSLNFKGFLLYLLTTYNRGQINHKIINSMITNLSRFEEFEFLEYFDIFKGRQRVNLLIEIAVELQFQLKTLTPEYLRYYVLNRCNDEMTFWLGIENNVLSLQRKKKSKRQDELTNYKIKVLNELISIEDDRLKRRKQERNDLQNNFF